MITVIDVQDGVLSELEDFDVLILYCVYSS
jgi:hypothetical protein